MNNPKHNQSSIYIDNSYYQNEGRRLKLVNAISIISFVAVWIFIIIYVILDVSELAFRIKLLSSLSVGTLLPLILNKFKLHQLAKISVASYNTLLMLLFIVLFRADKTSGHTFFLIYGLIPIFIWSSREWPFIAGFYITNLLCYVFIEFVHFDYLLAISTYTPETDFLGGFTVLLSFVTATIAIAVFHRLAHQKETELKRVNEQIKIQKKELQRTNEILQEKISALTVNEKNLNEANSVKSKIFSIIAHDLKSPFSSLKGLLELIVSEYDNLEDQQRKRYIESIYNTSLNTYSLLDNLLDWSRLQTNRFKVDKRLLKLTEICTTAINLNESRINKKELKILSNISDDLYVYADKYMLSTILRNLLSNAVKYTPLRGTITIKTELTDNTTKISISDTGVGMSSYDIDQLFNVDKNFTKPGTENEKGTGLGLLVCKEFIELNGGKLEIESEEGIGSTFYFHLETT